MLRSEISGALPGARNQRAGGSLLIPAAFTLETGRAHWHSLLRARAIENLSFVVAAAQWGEHQSDESKELSCFGHSLAFGPWGEVLVEARERGDSLLRVELDRTEILRRRQQLPVFESVKTRRWKSTPCF